MSARQAPGVLGMFAAGVQVTARHRGLVIALYAVQLVISVLFLLAAQLVLSSAFGHRPLFSHGVAGDLGALIQSFSQRTEVAPALLVVGGVLALGYFVLSLFLIPGLIGAFSGLSFGDAAIRWFPAYLRLWLSSLIPYTVCVAVVGVGVMIGNSGEVFERLISVKLLYVRPLVFAIPGLVLLAVTTCAVDYARAHLVVGNRRGALRALLGGFGFVLRNPQSLVHYALFLAFWGAVTAVYMAMTYGEPFAGAAGAWTVFALRQLVSILRFGARVVTTGGQVALAMRTTAPQ